MRRRDLWSSERLALGDLRVRERLHISRDSSRTATAASLKISSELLGLVGRRFVRRRDFRDIAPEAHSPNTGREASGCNAGTEPHDTSSALQGHECERKVGDKHVALIYSKRLRSW